MSGITVMGGQMAYPGMTNKLDGKEYANVKAHIWLHMLNDRMRPTKWNKANKNGTKVTFESVGSQEDYDIGIAELKKFLAEVKKEYTLDIELLTKEEEEEQNDSDNQ